MTYESFDLSFDGGVAHLKLNRPEKRNAMTESFWRELPDAVEAAEAEPGTRVLVLSSTGPHFCSGLDISMFQSTAEMAPESPNARLRFLDTLQYLLDAVQVVDRVRIPVIAVIQGGCIGGGVDLVSGCDIRIASSDAFFRIEEINIGMMADLGTLQRLPKLIPDGVARELAYTGAALSADRAERLGLVNAVHPSHEEAVEAALAMARTIAEKSPIAVAGSKGMMTYARDHSVAESIEHMKGYQAAIFNIGDIMESYTAKMEKRPARFEDLPAPRARSNP
ncbi:MAG: enoyl-CoA hydratase-related protein [Pseudomonadota bacterium]